MYNEVRKTNPAAAGKIIVVTGDIMEKGTGEFLDKEKLPYITKPIDFELLTQAVDRLVTGTP